MPGIMSEQTKDTPSPAAVSQAAAQSPINDLIRFRAPSKAPDS